MNKRQTGTQYEQLAAEYLRSSGYEIIMMNYRCKIGEIDIVAKNEGYLVFAEVKYRKNLSTGEPLGAIDLKKQSKIRKVSQFYLMEHKLNDVPVRFDAIGILGNEITLIKDAF